MTPAELRTPRLLLRAWRDDDLEPFAAMNADPVVMRYFPSTQDRATSDAGAARFAAIHEERGYTAWALEIVDSARGPASFVGFTGLVPPRWDAPFAHSEPFVEIGWRLAVPWWGLGLVTEAATAALHFGFDVLGLDEVVSFTVPPNLRSQAVMQRLGMRYDGVFAHPNATPGDWWRDHVLYRVSSADLTAASSEAVSTAATTTS